MNLLSSQSLFNKKNGRGKSNGMNKEIYNTIMVGSRLRNKFLKEKTAFSREAYNK